MGMSLKDNMMKRGKKLSDKINDITLEMRRRILRLAWRGKSGHIATSLSAVEILAELYFDNLLRYDVKRPDWEDRDRFVLSKGHASLLLYNILAKAGYFTFEELDTFCQPGTKFGSHPTIAIPGVEASTGALGHGYSYAVGVSISAKMDKKDYIVYTLLGDGECQEGSIWEAARSAITYNLNNLVTIVDYNAIQATDYTQNIVGNNQMKEIWKAWGFDVIEIDGNKQDEVRNALYIDRGNLPSSPRLVLAHTVKGKGMPLMENDPQWHSRIPTEEELNEILDEMGMSREVFEAL